MRRLIAIGLVFSLTGSAAESVLGELRDGTVHHESVAKAAIHHAESVRAEHGHEDGRLAPGGHHSSRHEHGTATDHCTHLHALGMVTTYQLAFHAHSPSEQVTSQPVVLTSQSQNPDFLPPKA